MAHLRHCRLGLAVRSRSFEAVQSQVPKTSGVDSNGLIVTNFLASFSSRATSLHEENSGI